MTNRQLDQQQVLEIIKGLEDRYDQSTGLHQKMKWRRQHYHNLPEANPPVPAGWEHCKIQAPILRDVGTELRSRLVENEWMANIKSLSGKASDEANAEEVEKYLVWMFSDLARRTGVNIQSGLSDGQIIDGYGVIHWYATNLPPVPDHEERDEIEDGDESYTEDEYEEVTGKRKRLRYRETDDALEERWRAMCAQSGGPVMVELPDPQQVYIETDRSGISQFRRVLFTRALSVVDYLAAKGQLSKEETHEALTGEVAPLTVDNGTLDASLPSGARWGDTIILKQLWERGWCYEVVSGLGEDDFKAYRHPWGYPPFAIAPGALVRSNDPALAYEPMLESIYRVKPQYDRQLSLYLALGEGGAIRRYYLEENATGAPMLTESGDQVLLMSPDAAAAMKIPSGYTMKSFGGEGVTGDFIQGLKYIWELMEAGKPGTGRAQFGASTQPWSARIEQSQENIEPKMCLMYQTAALQAMTQSIIDYLADADAGPGEVSWRGEKQIATVKAEQFRGLVAEVNIPAASSAERVTLIEHGMVLLEKGLITDVEFYGEYMGKPNPLQYFAEIRAWGAFKAKALPGLEQKSLAEYMGKQFVIGPDGVMMDMTGSAVPPEQILAQNGVQPIPPPQQGRQQRGPVPQRPAGGMGTTPGNLAGMAAPGTLPLGGMSG